MKKDYWKKYSSGIICTCGILLVLLSLVYEVVFAGPALPSTPGIGFIRDDFHGMISVYLFFSGLSLLLAGSGMILYRTYFGSHNHHHQHGSENSRLLR